MDLLAANVPAGSDGLIFLPYLEGERSPIFDSRARGTFFRIGSEHNKAYFLRAVLEGIGYGLRSILEIYREQTYIPRIRIIGGGAKSPIWLQIIADICDVELETLGDGVESLTSLGAAFAAGVGVGAYSDLKQAISHIHPTGIIRPNPANRIVYDEGFSTYTALYPCVKELF